MLLPLRLNLEILASNWQSSGDRKREWRSGEYAESKKASAEQVKARRIAIGIIQDDAAIARAEAQARRAVEAATDEERRLRAEAERFEQMAQIEDAIRKREEVERAAMYVEELLVEYRKISVQMDKYRRAAILLLLA